MFVALWEYEVKKGNEELFERIYGPQGDWARMFRGDPDYRETLLLRDVRRERVYLTLDAWNSRGAYDTFREARRAEYEKLDEACAELTAREKRIGEYESTGGAGPLR